MAKIKVEKNTTEYFIQKYNELIKETGVRFLPVPLYKQDENGKWITVVSLSLEEIKER